MASIERVRENIGSPASKNIVPGRQVRQVHVRKHIRRTLLCRRKLSLKDLGRWCAGAAIVIPATWLLAAVLAEARMIIPYLEI
jgi:hypothetical protein